MKLLVAIAISGMLLTGCSKSVDSKSKTFTYPLALGNQWTYTCLGTWEHGDPLKVDTADVFTIRVTVEQADTIRPEVVSYTTRAIEVGSAMRDGIPECTYLDLPEGMYLLSQKLTAIGATSPVLPRQVPRASDAVSIPPLAGFQNTDGLVASLADPAGLMAAQAANPADTLPLVFAYPQHSGLSWTYHDTSAGWSYQIDKVIEGRETITTPAGSFDCWRIRNINGTPWGNLHVLDYISVEGLIRRRTELRFSSGNWIDTYDLKSFDLH